MNTPTGSSSFQQTVPICAIGTSEGDVTALRNLLRELPGDLGLAYLVVADGSANDTSWLEAALAPWTEMPVRTIAGGQRLSPDCIHIVPPDIEVEIGGVEVATRPASGPNGRTAPVDAAFRSLARALSGGLGIVLSGGPDGSAGVHAIRQAGGIVLAQSPAEAHHPELPSAAIASGAVDFVLPVREIARRAAALARGRGSLPALEGERTTAALRRIAGRVHARTGHDISGYDHAILAGRVERRMRVMECADLAAYEALLHDAPGEAQALFVDLAVPRATFFRDPAALEALAREAVPAIVEGRHTEDGVRAWVVGCATGEEAYSVAILLLEEQDRRDEDFPVQVFATDLDPASLEAAREGRYPHAIEADVSPERLRQFFVRGPTDHRVNPRLRGSVLFAGHSVTRDPPFARMDLVACRGVLGVMARPLAVQVTARLHRALRPGAHMFAGEGAFLPPELFDPVDTEARIHVARPPPADRPGEVVRMPSSAAGPPVRPYAPPSPEQLHADILEASAPPSVLVDDERRILHLSATAGRFLRPSAGPLPVELPGLVRPELREGLADALRRALAEEAATLTRPVLVDVDGARRRVALHVLPTAGPWALVLFLDGGPEAEADDDLVDDRSILVEQLRRANERLHASRGGHEAAIRDLRAMTTTLTSVEGKRRSDIDALETARAELQAVQQELRSVGGELTSARAALASAQADLTNLSAASEAGALLLDPALRMRRVTPPAAELLGVAPGSVDLELARAAHPSVREQVTAMARRVLSDLAPVEAELEGADGRWHVVRLRPYRTAEDRIDGVVMSSTDVTRRREAEGRHRALLDAMEDGYVLLAPPRDAAEPTGALVLEANAAARRTAGQDLEGAPLGSALTGPDAHAQAALEGVLRAGRRDTTVLHPPSLGEPVEVVATPVPGGRVALVLRKRPGDVA